MDDKQWEIVKGKYQKKQVIRGVVEYHTPFGVFLDIDEGSIKGLIPITNFLDEGVMSVDLYPSIGNEIEAVIIDFSQDNRYQIWLSVKPSSFQLITDNI